MRSASLWPVVFLACFSSLAPAYPTLAGLVEENPVLDAVDLARRASVSILAPGADEEDEAVGAGFLDSGSGRIVTNEHVIGDRFEVRMGTADGRVVLGRVIARDPTADIALIEADLGGTAGLAFSTAPVRIGQAVYAVGSPFGLNHSVTR